jgi:hypothetical protein
METTLKLVKVSPLVLVILLVWAILRACAAVGVSVPEITTSSASVNYEVGQMISTQSSGDLTNATKNVAGAYAYWEKTGDSCFFGVQTPFSWAANMLPDQCPNDPDDEQTIAQLLERLWASFTGHGYSWAELIAMGGKAAAHVTAIVELARAYGVTLTP